MTWLLARVHELAAEKILAARVGDDDESGALERMSRSKASNRLVWLTQRSVSC